MTRRQGDERKPANRREPGGGPWAPEIPLPGQGRERPTDDHINRTARAARQGGDGEDH